MSSIEANLRAGEGHGPFMLALEYEGEAVGKHTPIVLMQGMIKGTREEMVKQVVYCAERVGALMPKEGPARVKFIVNTKGGGFRVPDSDYRAAVFDILQGSTKAMHSSPLSFFLSSTPPPPYPLNQNTQATTPGWPTRSK